MAILKHGINGPFSGKVGTVIGYTYKGLNIIRAKGFRSVPPSAKELLNRKKFALSQAWLSPLLPVLRIGFKDYKEQFEGFVAAKSYLHKHAMLLDEQGEPVIDPAKVLICYGEESTPENAQVQLNEENKLVFSWDTPNYDSETYHVMALAYDVEECKVIYNAAMALKRDGTGALRLQSSTLSRKYHCYLAFLSDDRSRKSNSVYVGTIDT